MLACLSLYMFFNKTNKQETVKIPDSAIRFRVLANSNSPRDQKIKEEVRDKMQAELYSILENSKSIKQARSIISDNMDNFDNIVREEMNYGIIAKFENLLDSYLSDGKGAEDGIPSVKYFADKVALSPNYFGDLVKRETGVTAQDYIHEKVLNQAKMRLLSGDKNVSQVAYSLGFQYPQHFIRFFKRKAGVTPKEFINMN